MTVQYGGVSSIVTIPLYGLDAAIPAANSVPDGTEWFSTDLNGGTLKQSQGGSWVTVGPGATQAPQAHALSHAPGQSDDVYELSGHRPTNRVQTCPQWSTSENFGPSNGNLYLVYFTPPYNLTVSNIYLMQWSTAAASYTLMRYGIYTVAGNNTVTLVAATNDLHASGANLVGGASNQPAFGTNAAVLYQMPLALAGDLSTPQLSYNLVRGTRYAFGFIHYSAGAVTAPLILEPQSSNAHGQLFFTMIPRLSAVRTGRTDLDSSITNAQMAATGRFPWMAAD